MSLLLAFSVASSTARAEPPAADDGFRRIYWSSSAETALFERNRAVGRGWAGPVLFVHGTDTGFAEVAGNGGELASVRKARVEAGLKTLAEGNQGKGIFVGACYGGNETSTAFVERYGQKLPTGTKLYAATGQTLPLPSGEFMIGNDPSGKPGQMVLYEKTDTGFKRTVLTPEQFNKAAGKPMLIPYDANHPLLKTGNKPAPCNDSQAPKQPAKDVAPAKSVKELRENLKNVPDEKVAKYVDESMKNIPPEDRQRARTAVNEAMVGRTNTTNTSPQVGKGPGAGGRPGLPEYGSGSKVKPSPGVRVGGNYNGAATQLGFAAGYTDAFFNLCNVVAINEAGLRSNANRLEESRFYEAFTKWHAVELETQGVHPDDRDAFVDGIGERLMSERDPEGFAKARAEWEAASNKKDPRLMYNIMRRSAGLNYLQGVFLAETGYKSDVTYVMRTRGSVHPIGRINHMAIVSADPDGTRYAFVFRNGDWQKITYDDWVKEFPDWKYENVSRFDPPPRVAEDAPAMTAKEGPGQVGSNGLPTDTIRACLKFMSPAMTEAEVDVAARRDTGSAGPDAMRKDIARGPEARETVRQTFKRVLGRDPSKEELDGRVAQNEQIGIARVERDLRASPEGRIVNMYRLWLGRDPTPTELAQALAQVQKGDKTIERLQREMALRPDARETVRERLTVMGQPPSEADVDAWLALLASGKARLDDLDREIEAQKQNYREVLGREPVAADVPWIRARSLEVAWARAAGTDTDTARRRARKLMADVPETRLAAAQQYKDLGIKPGTVRVGGVDRPATLDDTLNYLAAGGTVPNLRENLVKQKATQEVIENGYQRVLGRRPTDEEVAEAREYLRQGGNIDQLERDLKARRMQPIPPR